MTRTELIELLRDNAPWCSNATCDLQIKAADMLEADAVEAERLTLGWNAANVDVLHHAMTIDKLQAAARLALDALTIMEKNLAYVEITEAITALNEALK